MCIETFGKRDPGPSPWLSGAAALLEWAAVVGVGGGHSPRCVCWAGQWGYGGSQYYGLDERKFLH